MVVFGEKQIYEALQLTRILCIVYWRGLITQNRYLNVWPDEGVAECAQIESKDTEGPNIFFVAIGNSLETFRGADGDGTTNDRGKFIEIRWVLAFGNAKIRDFQIFSAILPEYKYIQCLQIPVKDAPIL